MNGYLILPLIQILLSFSLMSLVLLTGKRAYVHRLLSLILFTLGLWGIFIFGMRASPDTAHALFWERLLTPILFIVPTVFYHFALAYTGAPLKKRLLALCYTLTAVTVPLSFTKLLIIDMQVKDYGYAPVFGPLMFAGFLYIIILSLLTVFRFNHCYRNSPDPRERTRAVYVMLGIASLITGGVFDVLPVFGLPLYPGFIIGTIIFTVLTSVAILKHNLLDIHVVLRKSAAYFLTTSSFILFSITVSLLLADYLRNLPQWAYLLILFVYTLMVPIAFAFFQRRVDGWFYRDRHNFLRALELFNSRTPSLTDRALGQEIVELLARGIHVSKAHLLLPTGPKGDLTVCFTTNGISPGDFILNSESPLIKYAAAGESPLSRHELELLPQFVGRDRALLSELGVELMIPGRTSRGKLAALVLLGKKNSAQPYTAEEKRLLQTFTDQMATRLENTMLYEDALQMREQLEVLSRRLVQIQEEERRGIARELHDEIGQSLVMTKMLLDKAIKSVTKEAADLDQAQTLVKEVIGQVREMSLNLRPSILDDLGLLPAVQWFLDRYTERTGIRVDVVHENIGRYLPSEIRIGAYRVIQEGLNNVAKHARTRWARLSITVRSGNLHIEIMDSGVGFDPGKVSVNSIGLSGMRERVGMLGGSIQVDSAPGAGTWLAADLPLGEGRENDNQNRAG